MQICVDQSTVQCTRSRREPYGTEKCATASQSFVTIRSLASTFSHPSYASRTQAHIICKHVQYKAVAVVVVVVVVSRVVQSGAPTAARVHGKKTKHTHTTWHTNSRGSRRFRVRECSRLFLLLLGNFFPARLKVFRFASPGNCAGLNYDCLHAR